MGLVVTANSYNSASVPLQQTLCLIAAAFLIMAIFAVTLDPTLDHKDSLLLHRDRNRTCDTRRSCTSPGNDTKTWWKEILIRSTDWLVSTKGRKQKSWRNLPAQPLRPSCSLPSSLWLPSRSHTRSSHCTLQVCKVYSSQVTPITTAVLTLLLPENNGS